MALQIGPLTSTVGVVAFLVFTGMAWFNGLELLCTIFLSFKRWHGRYFYCLVIASVGALLYQTHVFLMVFEPNVNTYANLTSLNIGWTGMVTGQSLVLWSRLHLVCRSRLKLNLIKWMIIIDGVVMHSVNYLLTMLAIKGGVLDATDKAFAMSEKVVVGLFTLQELIISSVYLWETVRILRAGQLVKQKNRHRIEKLFLANIAIICLDITTVTLEFLSIFGVWCSFKGFGYTVKLKIEFAILNQLRDSVKADNGNTYDHSGSEAITLSSRRGKKSTKPNSSALERNTFNELEDQEAIVRTTQISIKHGDRMPTPVLNTHGFTSDPTPPASRKDQMGPIKPPSAASSEVGFASKGL